MWTFSRDGNTYDAECVTMEEAQIAADDVFAEECYGLGMTKSEDKITLIEFDYDKEGEWVTIQEVPGVVEFESYHGDFKEHNVWGKI